jgi:hypothetical protein
LIGRVGSSSAIGTRAGSPYTAAVEEKTMWRTPAAIAAEISEWLASVLLE